MIRTKTEKHEKGEKTIMTDDSVDVAREYGPQMVAAVKAAMAAGHKEFTVPTKEDDDRRLSWKTKTIVHLDGDKLKAFRVASIEDNGHCEILGGEVMPATYSVDATNVAPGHPESKEALQKR
jgi:hypothetical protein